MRDDAAASLRALNEVVEQLRAPGGCPWDGAQTHASLRPYLLEETYEALDAIDSDGLSALQEELGDVLLQVLMHCAIAAEGEDGFDVGDVAETTRAKMIHRHPHVFGDTAVGDAAEVVVNWERLKRSEKSHRLSLLDGIPRALPALAYAQGLQKRPARLGFDETPAITDAVAALRQAIDALASLAEVAPSDAVRGRDWTVTEGEIRRHDGPLVGADSEAAAAPPMASLDGAVGELLFAAVALARRLRVNPEDALRARSNRFADRFRSLERQASADGADLHDVDASEWRRRWEATAPDGVHKPPTLSK
ncbi:MAG: MazG family protein [Candidatus Dormibacter sp.]